MSRMPASLSLALYGLGAVDWQGAARRTGWPYRSPLERPRRGTLLVGAAACAGIAATLVAGRTAAAVAGVPRREWRRVAAVAPLGVASPLPLVGLALQAAVEASLGRALAESATAGGGRPGPAGDAGDATVGDRPAPPGRGSGAARVGRAVAGMTAWAVVQALGSALAGRVLDVAAQATDPGPWELGGASPRAPRTDPRLDVVGPDVTAEGPEGYVVYLDGVGRHQARTTPTGRAFAAAVTDRLPRWRVVLSVMPNDVTQRPVTERPLTGPLWRRLERRGRTAPVLRGMWEALVGLDPRYVERLAHDQTGNLLSALLAAGYEPGSGRPIVVVGYSGGAQVALRTASAVARGVGGAPLDVVTFGAFADGSADLGGVRRVHAAVSWGDPAELLPVLLFPSRWTALGVGAWSAAQRRRAVVVRRHDYATHLGRTGYLSAHATTADGRSRLAQAADLVATAARELTGDRHARSRGVRRS